MRSALSGQLIEHIVAGRTLLPILAGSQMGIGRIRRETSASYISAVILTRRSPEMHPSTLVTCRGRPTAR